ncbi:hypothetical protein ALC56_02621 [Trachymyrmex septentrionalis]|uniref:Uncharacterized protein n=1 Tax=Trachymyrmex septentrionalis TaxID=34720 RepID=A0A195FSE1_9HYME|nr:hypothetical protein ALC56_02621 [Trachymyrmex septentrionalis]
MRWPSGPPPIYIYIYIYMFMRGSGRNEFYTSRENIHSMIILFCEILMNDSIEYFFLHNLTVGLILRDYFELQEIPFLGEYSNSESYRGVEAPFRMRKGPKQERHRE